MARTEESQPKRTGARPFRRHFRQYPQLRQVRYGVEIAMTNRESDVRGSSETLSRGIQKPLSNVQVWRHALRCPPAVESLIITQKFAVLENGWYCCCTLSSRANAD